MLVPQQARLATRVLSDVDRILNNFDHEGQITVALPFLIRARENLARLLREGDSMFLRMSRNLLPPETAKAGELLLTGVREVFPGELRQRKVHRFVETPHNFWAVRIQPQKKNYYLSIYGRRELYEDSSFRIKRERGSYSRFYIQDQSEVAEALRLIFRAKGLVRNPA